MAFCDEHHVPAVADMCDRRGMRGTLNLPKRVGVFQPLLTSFGILMRATLLVMSYPCVPTSWTSEDALTSAVAAMTTLPLRASRRGQAQARRPIHRGFGRTVVCPGEEIHGFDSGTESPPVEVPRF